MDVACGRPTADTDRAASAASDRMRARAYRRHRFMASSDRRSRKKSSAWSGSLESRVRLDAHEGIVRIQVIHVVTGDDLVLDEHRRRGRPAAEQLEGQMDHP